MGWQDSINLITPTNPDKPKPTGRAPHVEKFTPVDQAARVGTIGGQDARAIARYFDEVAAHHEAGGDGGVTPGLSDHAAGVSSSRKLRDDGSPHH